jgi:hypothetical protein
MLLLVSWSRPHQVSFHLVVTATTFIYILLINIYPKVKLGTASTVLRLWRGFVPNLQNRHPNVETRLHCRSVISGQWQHVSSVPWNTGNHLWHIGSSGNQGWRGCDIQHNFTFWELKAHSIIDHFRMFCFVGKLQCKNKFY